jgi:hypothetical protein
MKDYNIAPMLLACNLSICANILFIVNIVPEWVFRLGFVIVVISSIVMNISTMISNVKGKNTLSDNSTIKTQITVKPIFIYVSVLILVFWIVSYIAAVVSYSKLM